MSLKGPEKRIIDDTLCRVEQFDVHFRGEEELLEGTVKLFSTFSWAQLSSNNKIMLIETVEKQCCINVEVSLSSSVVIF